jgi:HAAS
MAGDDLIEAYLDRLVERLRGPGDHVRRALAESEDHLRHSQAEGVEHGLGDAEAAQIAIDRFGDVDQVAMRYNTDRVLASPFQVALQVLLALALTGSIMLVAIGFSGVVAGVGGAAFGHEFIAGDRPGVTYTEERCDEYRSLYPEAPTCEQAALSDHYDEVVYSRIAAGVLGLVVLGGWWAVRWLIGERLGPSVIPTSFVPTALTALFAAAAAVLGGVGFLDWLFAGSDSGAGNFLSGGIVSAVAFLAFGAWLVATLRNQAAA